MADNKHNLSHRDYKNPLPCLDLDDKALAQRAEEAAAEYDRLVAEVGALDDEE
jgi:hypothetical protein